MQYVTRGLAAMVANRQRQQAFELANQKMVQDAALDQAKFEESRREFALSYSLKAQDLAETGALNAARAEYYRNAGKAKLKGMQLMNDWNIKLADQQAQAMKDFDQSKLNDPDFQTKSPIEYASKARQWMDEWGNSPNAQIKRNMMNLQDRVKSLNVVIPKAVQIEGSGPDQVVKGVGGSRQVSALEIIDKLNDPTQQDQMMNLLQAGNYFRGSEKPTGYEDQRSKFQQWWDKQRGVKPVPPAATETTRQIQDPVASWLKQSKGVDFSRRSSKVPEMMAPSAATNKGTGDIRQQIQDQVFGGDNEMIQDDSTPADQPDTSSVTPAAATPATIQAPLQFGNTQQEQALAQARAALQAGAPFPAIAQRLQAMSIDPQLLLKLEPASNIFNDEQTAIA